MSSLLFPTDDFSRIVQACRADDPLPADDPRLADLSALRDQSSAVVQLSNTLEQELEEGQFHRGILSGHRGSGKSTELLQLKAWADANQFLCSHVEVDTALGNTQLEFSDLYLLAAQSVVREMEARDLPLPEKKLERVNEWFATKTQQDIQKITAELKAQAGVKMGVGAIFGKLFAQFSASGVANSEHQIELRRTFRQAPNELIDLTNDLLRAANEKLIDAEQSGSTERGILLLFDNLDRYPAEAIELLLTRGATLMQKIACHVVYTIPVELRCRAGNVFNDGFDADVMLPMPALRARGTAWAATVDASQFVDASLNVMKEMLEKRIVVDTLFENANDARQLVKLSGGCVRDLMHLITRTRQHSGSQTAQGQERKLTSSAVKRAARDERDNRSEGLSEADYLRLAQIARRLSSTTQLDETALRLLGRRCILQYLDDQGRWLDIHPLLLETPDFRRAWDSLDSA